MLSNTVTWILFRAHAALPILHSWTAFALQVSIASPRSDSSPLLITKYHKFLTLQPLVVRTPTVDARLLGVYSESRR